MHGYMIVYFELALAVEIRYSRCKPIVSVSPFGQVGDCTMTKMAFFGLILIA